MGTTRTNLIKKNFIWKRVDELSKDGLGYSEKKLIAEFVLDCDSTKRTALELIKNFEDAERMLSTFKFIKVGNMHH